MNIVSLKQVIVHVHCCNYMCSLYTQFCSRLLVGVHICLYIILHYKLIHLCTFQFKAVVRLDEGGTHIMYICT